ncbi:MAG: hypothetical protein ACK5A3_03025, partial [Planctomyces sp.]
PAANRPCLQQPLVAISPIGFPELKFPQTVTDPEKTAASESQIRKQKIYTRTHPIPYFPASEQIFTT